MKKLLLFTLMLAFFAIAGPKAISQNMVVNGDLEQWTDPNTPTGWNLMDNIDQATSPVHGGTYSAQQTSAETTSKLSQDISGVVPGTMYHLSYWYYDNETNARTRRWCYWLSGGSTMLDPATDTLLRPSVYSTENPSWINWTLDVTAPAGADGFRFEARGYRQDMITGGHVYYDDFSMQIIEGTPEVLLNECRVSPNPASDYLTISTPGGYTFIYQLFSMIGHNAVSGMTTGSQTIVDVSNLQPGMYFLRLTETSTRLEKVIKVFVK
ncbi:MAG: T9SS type A sorting domain-containing protein [Bacteroidetes bacterium]|nr:T9SS type A sorting domain-containing protein [Bacteroidota bacterium]